MPAPSPNVRQYLAAALEDGTATDGSKPKPSPHPSTWKRTGKAVGNRAGNNPLPPAVAGMDVLGVTITIPIRTINPLNAHELPYVRSARAKREREATMGAILAAGIPRETWDVLAAGCLIRLTRLAPRPLSADEGLRASLKHVRDVLAVQLWGGRIGQRDENPAGVWLYGQVKGEPGMYGVIASISTRESQP